jgi:hypothetical protein
MAAGVPMFPDLLVEPASRLIPSPVFLRVSSTLYFQARTLPFAVFLVAQLLAGAIIGGAGLRWLAPQSRDRVGSVSPWTNGLILAVALWVVTGLFVLPAAGQGLFGAKVAIGAMGLNLALLIGFALFGLTAVATLRIIDDASEAARLAGSEVSRDQTVDSTDRRARAGRELA